MTKIKTVFKTTGYWSMDEWNIIENYYKEAYPDIDEEEITHGVNDEINVYYTNQRDNLYKQLEGKILVIADLGRWNGRRQGYRILDNNLNEILNTFNNDDIHIYSDGKNIVSEGADHDGHSYFTFREIRNGKNIEKLLDDIYRGEEITPHQLNYYTRSLVPYVNARYGWK